METINLGKVAFAYKGDYNPATTYASKDVVFDGESSYISKSDGNVGNALSDATFWGYLAKGSVAMSEQNAEDIDTLRADLNILNNVNTLYPAVPVYNRVIADTGLVRSNKTLNGLTQFLLDLRDNTKLLFCPELGVKLRTSGVNNYVTKLYDISPMLNDGAQTTALNQPFLSGNIAPNEKYAIKSPNNANTLLTHPTISFSSTDKWSVSTILNISSNKQNLEASLASYLCYCGKNLYESLGFVDSKYSILSNNATERATSTQTFNKYGKNALITWVAHGNGSVTVYENGNFITTLTVNTAFVFEQLTRGRTMNIYATIPYHAIRNIALSPTQVQEEYTYLRSIFPEVESVQIGTQTWATSNCEMTCTPQGNIIQEMQAATNVEKTTNGGLDTDTAWSKSIGVTIENGVAVYNNVANIGGINQNAGIKPNTWYKYSIKINSLTLGAISFNPGGYSSVSLSGTGIKTGYVFTSPSSNTVLYIRAIGTTSAEIDDISIQEVGWSDSTNLYNYVYANTTGTIEQKEYEAVKAAAMWCYYNNDPALGAVYGKLYNWFAVKLLQIDIDSYNAANPTTPWGWRVPAKSDLDDLSAYLGGNSISGGKMKINSINYWASPNSGADNSSGFSILGAGYRNSSAFNGVFSANRERTFICSSSEVSNGCYSISLVYDASTISPFNDSKGIGYSLRLIKV